YTGAKELYPLLCFLASGLGVIFLSRDIFNIYVGLEIVGLCAVALTAFTQKDQNIKAGIAYYFATLFGSGFYLLGVALLYAHYGVLDIELLSQKMQNDLVSHFAFICLALGLALKTALFPLHFWLPNAHANAAAPISALLSALIVKASFYLLYLFYFEIFDVTAIGKLLAFFGVVAIFYGGLQALFAKNIKLLIAYSTISQLGYLFLVFTLNNDAAHSATLLHIIAHALAKGGLFLASGVMIYYFASKKLRALKGLGSTLPVTAFTIALSAITIIGLPPSLGFFAKWHYLTAAFEANHWAVVAAVLLGGMLSASYLFKLLILSLQTPNKSVLQSSSTRLLESIAFTLALSSVLLGFFTQTILQIGGF
ncbi:MAG: complex I subunit 5 family protein, partial [Campylobacterota bacterium]